MRRHTDHERRLCALEGPVDRYLSDVHGKRLGDVSTLERPPAPRFDSESQAMSAQAELLARWPRVPFGGLDHSMREERAPLRAKVGDVTREGGVVRVLTHACVRGSCGMVGAGMAPECDDYPCPGVEARKSEGELRIIRPPRHAERDFSGTCGTPSDAKGGPLVYVECVRRDCIAINTTTGKRPRCDRGVCPARPHRAKGNRMLTAAAFAKEQAMPSTYDATLRKLREKKTKRAKGRA